MKSAAAGPWKFMTNWEQSLKWIFLKLYEKLLNNSTLTIIRSFGICSKLERWKFLISGCLMSWLQIKKIIVLKCHLLLFYTTNLLNWTVTCDEKWILYNWCSGWTEKQLPSTSQGQTCTKKGHGHCLMVCCPSDPLQLSESRWNHDIWDVCSANSWDTPWTATPAAGAGQQKGPTSSPQQHPTTCHTTHTSEVEWTGLGSFASSIVFTWPLSNRLPLSSSISTTFCRENASTTSRRQKCLPRIRWIPKHGFLCYRNKQTLQLRKLKPRH